MLARAFIFLIVFVMSACVTSAGEPNHWHDFDYWLTSSNRRHQGHDYAIAVGIPILAVSRGTVEKATSNLRETGGISIKINHGGLQVFYLHLGKLLVRKGDWVERGDVIAYSGFTGTHRGHRPHLHFEVRESGSAIDPYPNLWFGGEGKPLAFDPSIPYPNNPRVFTHPVAFGAYSLTARKLASQIEEQLKPKERQIVISWAGHFEERTLSAYFDSSKSSVQTFKVRLPRDFGECSGILPVTNMKQASWALVCKNNMVAIGTEYKELENGQIVARGADAQGATVELRIK